VKALDRKLLRDLGRLRGQVITISLVVACGIAQLFAFVTTLRSLVASRDAFYAEGRFGDLFVHLDRAPRALLARLEEIPGVSRVQGRVVGDFRLEVPGSSEPVLGRFVGLAGSPGSRLDDVILREGREIEPGSSREVVVSELFAKARGLHPGDSLVAVLQGREVSLRLVGVGLSPEFVWAPNPRTSFPDAEHFGVFWMDEKALALSMGLSGAFNDAVFQLSASAVPADVKAAVDRLLDPYGGLGVVARERQPSNYFLDMKLAQIRSMTTFIPVLFLAVAAFLLNLVLSRVVGTQREQIATLKALGYGGGALARHYLSFALVICLLGALLGVAIGALEGEALTRQFAEYFNLPLTELHADYGSAAIGIVASLLAGTAGAFSAVRRTARLPAAEAMQPEPPESFRRTVVERLGFDRLFGVAGRMVLRDMERHPFRLLLSALSVALATAIILLGSTEMDSLYKAVGIQFNQIQAEDMALYLDGPRGAQALEELSHVPGVALAEAQRVVPIRLKHGSRERELALLGVPPDAVLRRPRNNRAELLQLSPTGLALSRPLGEILAVQIGDEVEIEVLEAGRRGFRAPVDALVDDFAGLSAYMDLAELERRLGEPPTVSGAVLAIDRAAVADVTQRLERLPAVAGISRPDLDEAQFMTQEADAFRSFQVVLIIFAATIAVGMVFNNARIALAVRARDLATLRILGFTRGEVAVVLLGEQAVQLVLGVAVGLPLGFLFGAGVLALVPQELFRLPVSLAPSSLVLAASVVLVAGFLSALAVRREADRLDLVSVLKARD
jgi:putative ABC transport system permease protein